MKNTGIELTLEEIRKAQLEIAQEMSTSEVSRNSKLSLEQASVHLRNLERILVATIEKDLIASLKKETILLNAIAEEMNRTSDRLFKVIDILRKVVKYSGQVIDVLEMLH